MPTRCYSHGYVMLIDVGDPETFQKAMYIDHKKEWLKVMQDKMQSLYENHTYDLIK